MPKLYSASSPVAYLLLLLLGISLSCKASTTPQFSSFDRFVILPQDEESKTDCKWAEYLMRQSENRVTEKYLITNQKRNTLHDITIYVHIEKSATFDYALAINPKNEIFLTASSESIMLWLIYQWIAKVAETDKRWNASDLDPSIISINDTQKNFDFGYRSIYSSAMNDPDKIAIHADQHVDYNWGLWGHNLEKIFPKNQIPFEVQAIIKGTRNASQFCFSSEKLHDALSDYILNSFGSGNDGNTGWFAIMPNDNKEVCMCNQCIEAGNTLHSATPAVTSLLIRLAHEFPHHQFYTSAYHTTANAPHTKLPSNAGVIISAINLPLTPSISSSAALKTWKAELDKWKQVTDKIIVWDYMRNFDDYLTPYPCLTSIQKRLQWFKQQGVYGVFYNGSGDDYATFDDVQTYIISSLLKDTDIDIKKFTEQYFKQYYPKSWEILFQYYTSLEREITQKQITLEWYAGIDTSVNTYFDIHTFTNFYSKLDKLSKQVEEEERYRLNRLLTALNFTQLEIIRSGYSYETSQIQTLLELLKGASSFQNMKVYKESYGSLPEYIRTWQNIDFYQNEPDNLIQGKAIGDNKQLTDGYYGFPHDYHLHWNIYDQPDITLSIQEKFNNQAINIVFSFLNAPAWKIGCPEKIEIYQGKKLKGNWKVPTKQPDDFSVVKAHIKIETDSDNDPIEIKITRGKEPQTACDEIAVYYLTK